MHPALGLLNTTHATSHLTGTDHTTPSFSPIPSLPNRHWPGNCIPGPVVCLRVDVDDAWPYASPDVMAVTRSMKPNSVGAVVVTVAVALPSPLTVAL